MTINDVFRLGMKRDIQEPLPLVGDVCYDIGAGNINIDSKAIRLALPDWSFPENIIPASDGSVDYIHCYHFLEHLTGEQAIQFLIEVQRVLKTGGVFQYCVPYYTSQMQHHDLTHKSYWCEETMKQTFSKSYYEKISSFEWKLKVHFQTIIGIVERNLTLIGQLEKTE